MKTPFSPSATEAEIVARCEFRRDGQCSRLNDMLGWPSGLDKRACAACLAVGRTTPEASRFLWGLMDRTVRSLRHRDRFYPRDVLRALRDKHGVPVSNAEIEMSSIDRSAWDRVRPTWRRATALAKSVFSRAFRRPLDKDEIAERMRSCHGSATEKPCPARAKSNRGTWFCGACGCGDNKIADLTEKILRYPYLECPFERPGFSNASLTVERRQISKE